MEVSLELGVLGDVGKMEQEILEVGVGWSLQIAVGVARANAPNNTKHKARYGCVALRCCVRCSTLVLP